jgi:diadenylate cyclase
MSKVMGLIYIVTSLFEMFMIAVILNYFLSFFWNTRSMDLMLGAAAFLLVFVITSWLHLPILYKIMTYVANVAAIAALVIFQPELRLALSKLSLKGRRYREVTEFDKFLDGLTNSVYKLADKRIGALIALEHEEKLDEFAQKAVILNASFSSELLESIFANTTPLHDGAVVIRDMTILAAAVILPLAEDSSELSKSMGTRHRAALGISQLTDALVIAISEESGKISLARDGVITRGVKADRFKGIIRSIFTVSEEPSFKSRFNLKKWLQA